MKIGTHKIIIPDKAQLEFSDGLVMAETEIRPLEDDFIKGRIKIAVLIPEDREMRVNGCGYSTIDASFFTGLLEGLITEVTNTQAPSLRSTIARSRMTTVKNKSDPDNDAKDIISGMLASAWNAFDPIESFLRKSLAIGIYHSDGSHTLTKYNADREMEGIPDKDTNNKAFFWSYKYYKALDSMFFSNLNQRSLMQEMDKQKENRSLKL